MKPGIDRWRRLWKLFERGVLSDNEIVLSFLDGIDPNRLAVLIVRYPGFRSRAMVGAHLRIS